LRLWINSKKQIAKRGLLDLSELEQELACKQNLQDDADRLMQHLSGDIELEDALRLVLMFALRYQDGGQEYLSSMVQQLKDRGAKSRDIKLINAIISYAGVDRRSPDLDLFENKDLFAVARGAVNRGLKGVTNIFTQHTPMIASIINDLRKVKLSEGSFPFYGPGVPKRPKDIIIFIIGGITYEESHFIHRINTDQNIVLGGTYMHSQKTYLQDLRQIQ